MLSVCFTLPLKFLILQLTKKVYLDLKALYYTQDPSGDNDNLVHLSFVLTCMYLTYVTCYIVEKLGNTLIYSVQI